MNWKHLLLSVIILFLQKNAFSKSIFINFDPKWMDVYEYEMNDDGLIRQITTFYLKTNDKDGYFLKVGDLNRNKMKVNNINIVSKSDLALNEEMVREINSDNLEFFIVQNTDEGQFASKVLEANYFFKEENQFAWSLPQLVFSYDEADTFEKNLATEESRFEVNVLNIKKRDCSKIVTFQKIDKFDNNKQYQITICPHIGILSQQIVNQIEVKLQKINSVPIDEYFSTLCQKDKTVAIVETKEEKSPVKDVFTAKGESPKSEVKKSEAADPCSPTKVQGIHTVQEGESLYAISKQYSKTVKQLCEWNGIKQDVVLQPCTKLIVDNSPVEATKTEEFRSKGEAKVASPAWKENTSGFHDVKEGETIEEIASKYGYTSQRLLIINELKSGAELKTGQKLKINDCVCATPNTETKKTEVVPAKVNAESNPKILSGKSKTSPKGASTGKYYLVKEDDTLISIAKKFNTSLEQLRKLNQLDEKDIVVPFQKIRVE